MRLIRRGSPLKMAILCVAAICVVPVYSGCSNQAPSPEKMNQTVGGLSVNLETQPSPLHSGDNTLILTIVDAGTGAPVGNANIIVNANMVAPKMTGMEVSGRSQGNGRYEVPVRLALATRYNFQVRIAQPGRPPVNTTFSLEAPF